MIIVSQDKTEIVNFERIFSIKMYHDEDDKESLYELYCCVNAPGDNYILIGTYKTEERAKEVLIDIVKAIAENRKVEESKDLFGFSMIPSNTYYIMPEE